MNRERREINRNTQNVNQNINLGVYWEDNSNSIDQNLTELENRNNLDSSLNNQEITENTLPNNQVTNEDTESNIQEITEQNNQVINGNTEPNNKENLESNNQRNNDNLSSNMGNNNTNPNNSNVGIRDLLVHLIFLNNQKIIKINHPLIQNPRGILECNILEII